MSQQFLFSMMSILNMNTRANLMTLLTANNTHKYLKSATTKMLKQWPKLTTTISKNQLKAWPL